MFLVLAALVAPVLLRIAQVTNVQGRMAPADLRGILADLGVSVLLAVLAALLLKHFRRKLAVPCALLLLLGWSVLNFGNFEHITALGSVADWSNAKYLLDETFVRGSALHISDLSLFALSLLLTVLCFLVFIGQKEARIKIRMLPLFSAACLASLHFVPTDPAYASWRQTHFIIENLRRMTSESEKQTGDGKQAIYGIYPGDLDGTPLIALNKPRTNVLLVILEGISGSTLDSVAALNSLQGDRPRLPTMNTMLPRGLTYANFINHNRQTNRGMYSLLCGDLDKLVTDTPKMTEASLLQEKLFCMPEALRRLGYETAFLQSAPLSFMGKDAFAEKAGFNRFHGVEWFRESERISTWGVDDKLFLKKSADLVEELQKGGKPWFLTLLTAGTHHPFNVPESFKSANQSNTFSHAVDYLDQSLGEFFAALERSKTFDNTLVLFTSDESFGLSGERSNDEMMLSQAWGYLLAMTPEKHTGIVEQPFMQTDVAISVLDYLGARMQAERFRGRSIFRKYLSNRPIPFANTYLRLTGAFSKEQEVLICPEDFSSNCTKYPLADPAHLFAPLGIGIPISSPPEFMKALVAKSYTLSPALAAIDGPKRRELFQTPTTITLPVELMQRRREEKLKELQEEGRTDYDPVATFRLFGSQYLTVPKGEKMEVEIEIAVVSQSPAIFFHTLKGVAYSDLPSADEYLGAVDEQTERYRLGDDPLGMRPAFARKTQKFLGRTVEVPPGGTLRFHYSFGADQNYQRMQATLLAAPGGNSDAVIEVRKAELNIVPMKDAAAETGLKVQVAEPNTNVVHHLLGYGRTAMERD